MPKKQRDVKDETVQHKRRRIIHTQGKHSMLSSIDILLEILSRLPASSLWRLRFVSELWYSLITHPSLAELHLDRGFKSTTHPSIIARTNDRLFFIDELAEKVIHKSHVMRVEPKCSISPPCNGIICMYDEREVQLVNPITKEKLVLPNPLKSTICFSAVCLIGFLPTNHEYKVIRFYNSGTVEITEQDPAVEITEQDPAVEITEQEPAQTGCQVLTVGASSWRLITDHFVPLFRRKVDDAIESMTPYDGSAYFLACPISRNRRDAILISFDLQSEMIATINLPRTAVDGKHITLSKMANCLCISACDHRSFEIWMLKSITKRAHWRKKYDLYIPLVNPTPIFIHGGQLLLSWKDNFYYWDLKKVKSSIRRRVRRELTHTGSCYYFSGYIHEAYLHEGSLVSPSNLVKKV